MEFRASYATKKSISIFKYYTYQSRNVSLYKQKGVKTLRPWTRAEGFEGVGLTAESRRNTFPPISVAFWDKV